MRIHAMHQHARGRRTWTANRTAFAMSACSQGSASRTWLRFRMCSDTCMGRSAKAIRAVITANAANPMVVRRGIERAVEAAIEAIEADAKPVESKEQIAQVGAISANNDSSVGELIADAMENVGRDGVITVAE